MSFQGGKYFRVGFCAGVQGVKYHDVQARELFVMEAKRFTDNSFEPVTRGCGRQLFFRNGQAEPGMIKPIHCRQYRNPPVDGLTACCPKYMLKTFW